MAGIKYTPVPESESTSEVNISPQSTQDSMSQYEQQESTSSFEFKLTPQQLIDIVNNRDNNMEGNNATLNQLGGTHGICKILKVNLNEGLSESEHDRQKRIHIYGQNVS